MKKLNRRDFIMACSSGVSLYVLARINSAYAHMVPFGFWKNSGPLNILTTQCVAKAAVLDASFKLRTTQCVAKAAVLDASFKLQTTQLVVKVAIRP